MFPQFTRMLMIDRCVMSVLTRLIEVGGHKEGNKTHFNIRIMKLLLHFK